MATKTASPFLNLPREIRDKIYGLLSQRAPVINKKGPDEYKKTIVILANSARPELFRVNKQFGTEYNKVAYEDLHVLLVAGEGLNISYKHLPLKPTVPKALFQHVTFCRLHVAYARLPQLGNLESMFYRLKVNTMSAQEVEDNPSSPSKGMPRANTNDCKRDRADNCIVKADKLAQLLKKLAACRSHDARVDIVIAFEDKFAEFRSAIEDHVIQPTVFHKLQNSPDLPFASAGRLKVLFTAVVPLLSRVPGATAEACKHEVRADGTVAHRAALKEAHLWGFDPLPASIAPEYGFLGFFPHVEQYSVYHNRRVQ